MATVFRALDVKHGRTVAVKVLHPELSEALGPERFLREVRITAKLSHPHILPLLDSGASDGLLYYVMPFVEGESLRDRLVREGQLPVGDALRIAREVADALGNAHSLGIVHRDVKPENILLQGGHALVADFGIARAFDGADHQLTNTGIAIGTPLYMSPEQAHGEVTVDGRSDIYSLASVLFEMLTGEPPFVGPNAMAITTKKLTETPPPLRTRRNTVSASTEVAIARALARAPADRFRTAQEFAEALDASVTTGERAVVPVPSWRRPAIAAAAVLALVAAAWAAGRGGSAGAPGAGELSSVAVLPFENLSPDTAQAYFAIGLNDEIITSLSMVEGIRVSSRTSSSLVASQGLELKVIGERLGVESVVEGSVRAYGDRIRVAARLVKVADGYPIWSQTFERASDDALKIQSEIAGAIVEALKGRMVVGHLQAVSSGTTDPVAYDLYLQAQALRLRQTDASIARAVELLRESIRRAPDFARAHATLGTALAVQGWYEQRPPREVFPLAAQAAEEAMRLDPNLGSAQATRAYASLYFDWDLPRAEREFLRAIEIEPNSGIAHQWYGNLLAVQRRFADAEREFERAREIEPIVPIRSATIIWVRFQARDFRGAVEAFDRAIVLDTTYALTYLWASWALEASGRVDEAVTASEQAVRLSDRGTGFVASLARTKAVQGDGADARRLLAEVLRGRVVPAYEVAKIYLALGEKAEALRWLERAYEMRSPSMMFLRIDAQLDPLRGDPAFEALLRKVGI